MIYGRDTCSTGTHPCLRHLIERPDRHRPFRSPQSDHGRRIMVVFMTRFFEEVLSNKICLPIRHLNPNNLSRLVSDSCGLFYAASI